MFFPSSWKKVTWSTGEDAKTFIFITILLYHAFYFLMWNSISLKETLLNSLIVLLLVPFVYLFVCLLCSCSQCQGLSVGNAHLQQGLGGVSRVGADDEGGVLAALHDTLLQLVAPDVLAGFEDVIAVADHGQRPWGELLQQALIGLLFPAPAPRDDGANKRRKKKIDVGFRLPAMAKKISYDYYLKIITSLKLMIERRRSISHLMRQKDKEWMRWWSIPFNQSPLRGCDLMWLHRYFIFLVSPTGSKALIRITVEVNKTFPSPVTSSHPQIHLHIATV